MPSARRRFSRMRGLVVWLKDLERGVSAMVAEKILSRLVLGGMVAFMILGCSLDFRFFGCGGREDTMVGMRLGFLAVGVRASGENLLVEEPRRA
jgi:hypothetical protein